MLPAFLLAGAVGATDPEPVKLPHIEPGDCWTYQARGLDSRGPVRKFEECITFVDREKDVVLAVAKINGTEREVETTYTREWGTVVSVDGLIAPDAARLLRFPMRPGDRWETEFEFRLALRGPFAGRTRYQVRVAGWEEVTVPAGTFRALRIEATGDVHRYDLGRRGALRQTLWYSPEAHRWVKVDFQSQARPFQTELLEYRLNK